MELAEILRRRRMVRHYLDEPLDASVVDRIVAAGLRAPSAGYSQGYAFLVLEDTSDRARFWDVTSVAQETASWSPETRAGVMRAPLIVVALSCKRIYLERYARADKSWTDRDENRWPVPFWHIDTGMAALLMLLQAIDEGLGALFIGMAPAVIPAFREAFGVPVDHDVVGVVCAGHPDPTVPPRDLADRRRGANEVVHRSRW
ncbi:MAG TPA: nitroreductase family protein [Mycobacteriales bacterium]|nr:nitroreductase family protein [Mycobacteriales bacterium]